MTDAPPPRETPVWLRLLRAVFTAFVGIIVLLDEILSPIIGPVFRYIAGLRVFDALVHWVERLSPYATLAALVVPIVLVEPLKLVGIYWLASGRPMAGIATLFAAYAGSIVLLDKIFEAGKPKLMTIAWFAKVYGRAMAVKSFILERLRATAAWRAAHGALEGVRAIMRDLAARFRRWWRSFAKA